MDEDVEHLGGVVGIDSRSGPRQHRRHAGYRDLERPGTSIEVVLRALQQPGAVIYDLTTAGQDGAKLLAMSNGWAGTEYLTTQAELNKVPTRAFEVVEVFGIRVGPSTGWQISG